MLERLWDAQEGASEPEVLLGCFSPSRKQLFAGQRKKLGYRVTTGMGWELMGAG